MKIFRFGHAAVLVEAAGTRLLIDPGVFSPDSTFEIDRLDAIVVTHQHPDHLDPGRIGGLLERNPDATLLCDPETAGMVELGTWTAHADGDETVVGGLTLGGVGHQHAVIVDAIPRVTNTGVLVSADDEPTLFHPGDSYAHAPDGVDVLALPLSAPWTKVAETVDFVTLVSPTTLFPVHDGTIAEQAYDIYWSHVESFGGVDDVRRLGSTDSTTVG